MSIEAGDLVVRLKANLENFDNGIKKANAKIVGSAKKFAVNYGAIAAAAGAAALAIGAGAMKAIKAYGEQEQAIAALEQALRNQGISSQAVTDDLLAHASALQRLTTYGDETITSTHAQLVAFGLEGAELKMATERTLDLATAKKIDLKSAADLVGKAFVGETGTLSRYGIVLGEGIPKTEKFAAAMEKMNEMFGGQAAAMRDTTLGQMKALDNAVGDVWEELGGFLASDAVGFTKWLITVAENTADSLKMIREASEEFGGFFNVIKFVGIEALRELSLALIYTVENYTTIGMVLKLVGVNLDGVKEKLNDQYDTWQGNAQAAAMAAAAAQKGEMDKRAAIAATNAANAAGAAAVAAAEAKKRGAIAATVAAAVGAEETIKLAVTTGVGERIKAEQQLAFEKQTLMETEGTLHGDLTTKLKNQIEDWRWSAIDAVAGVTDQFGDGVADMIMEGKRFSDVIKNIWKDLARQVVREIARIIAKWMVLQVLTRGKAGYIVDVIGGYAHGGMINEPSIITGLQSGKSHFAGESGPEMVVPMGGGGARGANKPFDRPQGGGGNVNVTINISGQFIEGNENNWQRLFRERILPEIRRATMSNPTGNFNRRRGATA